MPSDLLVLQSRLPPDQTRLFMFTKPAFPMLPLAKQTMWPLLLPDKLTVKNLTGRLDEFSWPNTWHVDRCLLHLIKLLKLHVRLIIRLVFFDVRPPSHRFTFHKVKCLWTLTVSWYQVPICSEAQPGLFKLTEDTMAIAETLSGVPIPLIVIPSLLCYFTVLGIYRLFFDSLAKFPGPKLAALTRYYEAYYDVIQNGQYTFKIDQLHRQYGVWTIV